MSEHGSARPLTLTERTLLPIGIVVTILAGACGGTWWMAAICNRLDRIEAAIHESTAHGVDQRDLRMWIMSLKQANGDKIQVPLLPARDE